MQILYSKQAAKTISKMDIVSQINSSVKQLPQKNQLLILELIQSMIHPDDFLSEEDIKDIKQAREEIARGEYVRHEDIDWN